MKIVFLFNFIILFCLLNSIYQFQTFPYKQDDIASWTSFLFTERMIHSTATERSSSPTRVKYSHDFYSQSFQLVMWAESENKLIPKSRATNFILDRWCHFIRFFASSWNFYSCRFTSLQFNIITMMMSLIKVYNLIQIRAELWFLRSPRFHELRSENFHEFNSICRS